MSKKIFMPKNNRSGGSSSAKLLLWPAIGLIVLVLLVTLIMQPREGRENARKPASEGAIVREIPRPLVPEETSPVPQQLPVEAPGIALQEPKPLTPEHQESPSAPGSVGERETPADPAPSPLPGAMRAEEDPVLPGEFVKPEPAPQKLDPQFTGLPTVEGQPDTQPKAGLDEKAIPIPTEESKRPAVAAVPPGTGKLMKSAPASMKPVPEAGRTGDESKKKMASGGKSLFAVQVGSFKEKHNADEIRANLEKRGYDVVMKTKQDSKLGQIYVIQLKPVANKGKASTLMEQVKNEQKVQPMIIEVRAGVEGQQ